MLEITDFRTIEVIRDYYSIFFFIFAGEVSPHSVHLASLILHYTRLQFTKKLIENEKNVKMV